MESTIERIKDAVVGFVEFIQSIIFIGSILNTLVAPAIKIFEDMSLPNWISKYSEIFNVTSVGYLVNCIIMVVFIVKLVVVIILKDKTKNEELIDIIDCLHTNYFHNMRDHIHRLEETEKLLPKKPQKGIDKFERYYNDEYKRLESITQSCVNQVSDVINGFMGMPEKGKSSICACIKMISIYEKDKPIAERSLITLARSKNSSNKRIQKNKKDIIGKNTDFLDLSEGYRNYYYGIGLRGKYEKGEYNNSTSNFSYESTIVVPIRYTSLKPEIKMNSKGKKKQVEIKVKNDVDIVGYLCIDTEEILSDWENSDEVKKVVTILALYADTLYIYLSAFRRTFEKEIAGKD